MPIPQGKCDKCGEVYYGWALKDPKHQTCDKNIPLTAPEGPLFKKCGGTIVLKVSG